MAGVVVIVVALVASLGMAWALGASSNSPPFAPAVGANAVPTMRAAFFIGIFAGLGAVTQGGSISATVGTGLIDGVTITPLAATAGLLTAAGFIALGVWTGYPIPAAFATTGAMVGAGLALGGVVFVALRRAMLESVDADIRKFLVGLGAVVAFSSGGSQVGLATGPLEPLFGDLGFPGIALLGLGAVGILLGAWMGSPRLLQAESRHHARRVAPLAGQRHGHRIRALSPARDGRRG